LIVHLVGGGAFYIFLARQFFLTIPRELDEAARMDGAAPSESTGRSLPCRLGARRHRDVYFVDNWTEFLRR